MTRRKKQPEFITGLYSAIPHAVMDSKAFAGSSDRAKSLLYALMRQLNGRNNGRLHLTDNWLRVRGWPSAGMNLKTRRSDQTSEASTKTRYALRPTEWCNSGYWSNRCVDYSDRRSE